MKRLRYIGGSLLVGDALAHSVLAYARDLARVKSSDTVLLAGRTEEGEDHEAEMLIGPASQLVADGADGPESLPGEDAVVADLEQRRSTLTARTVRIEDQQAPEETDFFTEWPGEGDPRAI